MNSFHIVRPLGSLGRHLSSKSKAAHQLMDQLHTEVEAARFNNIIVIQTKFNADPRYMILASALSVKHLMRGTETVNKHYKNAIKSFDQEFANVSISEGWNVIDFKSVVVHLFLDQCRDRFDLEQLWAVGEKYDDQCALDLLLRKGASQAQSDG